MNITPITQRRVDSIYAYIKEREDDPPNQTEVAKHLGISRERVRQIVTQHNVMGLRPKHAPSKSKTRKVYFCDCGERVSSKRVSQCHKCYLSSIRVERKVCCDCGNKLARNAWVLGVKRCQKCYFKFRYGN